MEIALVSNTFSSITNGKSALTAAKNNADSSKFSELIEAFKSKNDGKSTISSSQIIESGRLNGEYSSGFAGTFEGNNYKKSKAIGAAANQANPHVQSKTIDRTSELYEKSMELENYFVKQMLSEMRKTVHKNDDSDFAMQTYEDMLYDEYATAMTKNAGFGLADQIYLSLV